MRYVILLIIVLSIVGSLVYVDLSRSGIGGLEVSMDTTTLPWRVTRIVTDTYTEFYPREYSVFGVFVGLLLFVVFVVALYFVFRKR